MQPPCGSDPGSASGCRLHKHRNIVVQNALVTQSYSSIDDPNLQIPAKRTLSSTAQKHYSFACPRSYFTKRNADVPATVYTLLYKIVGEQDFKLTSEQDRCARYCLSVIQLHAMRVSWYTVSFYKIKYTIFCAATYPLRVLINIRVKEFDPLPVP